MRQSILFTNTLKESPKDEQSKNAELLIRGGFINKEMAGVYSYLPLGLRVLNKINNIIREEMNNIGGQEVHLTVLQNPELWKQTNRWSDEIIDNWFKTSLKNGTELGMGFTHEEPLTQLMKSYVHSYKDLPAYVYQIQTKFRNEKRSKSGIMRCREFLMKDLYSFSRSQEEHDKFYEKSKDAYLKIFERCGLGNNTYITFASGGVFSKYSHEFQTLTDSGEDTIFVDKTKKIAVNKEVYTDEVLTSLGLDKKELVEEKAVEVGNIFTLGTKYSEPLGLKFTDENGKENSVIMGSYGIGPGRLMGTVAEIFNDESGLLWPEAVAPFAVHLVSLCKDEADIKKADDIYNNLIAEGVEVLYDDRIDASAGAKFADSDLIGIPKRIIVSTKTLAEESVEVKQRNEKESVLVKIHSL
ncbi:prolyl-tRNA synthetase [Patescibacteria group bacterium]|nr:prolyl-tRNA synthetase [Patescibacteria group bacterium]MBU1895426.1 prolyl-tRNA synthetase [Patescibacteria group bacterium]